MSTANARSFNGSTGIISLSIGSVNAFGPATVAGIVKKTTASDVGEFFGAGSADTWDFSSTSTDQLGLWNGTSFVGSPTTLAIGEWYCLAISKASGNVNARMHIYRYSTSTWVHEDSGTNQANSGVPTVRNAIGGSGAGPTANLASTIQCIAFWTSVLTDAQIETLAGHAGAWRALSPQAMWRLNQGDTGEAVFDEIGTAHQSAITSTATATGAPFSMVDQPAFINVGTAVVSANSVANPTTFSPGIPASMATGDLMLCITTSRSNSATVAAPSGWTVFPGFPVQSGTASGGTIYVFYRWWVSGDAAPSVSWSGVTTGTSGDSCMAQIAGYRYVDSDITDATVVKGTDAAITTTATIGSVTTGQQFSKVLGITMRVDDNAHTWTPTTNWAERFDTHTTTGTGHSRHLQERVFPAAGSTGSVTIAPSLTTSVRGLSATLALKARRRRDPVMTYADRSGASNLSGATFR